MSINSALVDQLNSGARWTTSSGSTAKTITFGITTSSAFASGYGEQAGWSAFNTKQADAARKSMTLWDDIIAPSFVEASDPNAADIKFSNTSTNISYAHAYFPSRVGDESYSYARLSGSVWLNSSRYSALRSPDVGDYEFQTIVHEVGHALGLNHAGNYNGGSPKYGVTSTGWEHVEDSWQYTVMSYFNASNTGADWYSSGNVRVQTPMVYDILAAQEMYGADLTTRSGNTIYGFNANAGNDIYDFTVNAKPVMTIWDGAGKDTIDLSGFTTAQRLDLGEGAYSDIGNGLTLNFAIAYGAKIENAVGGSGSDSITGNNLNNLLKGGAGNDDLYGLGGADTLEGGSGNDNFYGGAGNDIIRGGGGTDIVTINAKSTSITVSEMSGGVSIVGEGTDRVFSDVESFVFTDKTLSYSDVVKLIGGTTPSTPPTPPTPDPAPDGSPINFDNVAVESYSTEDKQKTAFDTNGTSLLIDGNTWKKTAVDYDVTSDTILTFSFRSTAQGEIQGIGFDNNDSISSSQTFNLAGSQAWGIKDLDYTAGGDWQTFSIRLGDYTTGQLNWLTFVNDDDNDVNGIGSSEFRDVVLSEEGSVPPPPAPTPGAVPIDFDKVGVESYSDQDKQESAFNIDGTSLSIDGNTWKKTAVDYDVTADTILTFSFRSTAQGEIQGIGFDNDDVTSSGKTFNVAGSQAWGIKDLDYTGAGDWQTFSIRLGDYTSGPLNWLTFVNDDDKSFDGIGNSAFRDVTLHEDGDVPAPPVPATDVIDFDMVAVESYSTEDKQKSAFETDGTSLLINGNTWKKAAVDYDVTSDTILTFTFRSAAEGEIQGIGFDNNDSIRTTQMFNLAGSQNWGLKDFEYTANGDWQTFSIRLGDYTSGPLKWLTFANDDDNAANGIGISEFRDVVLYEDGASSRGEFGAIVTDPLIFEDDHDYLGHDHAGHDPSGFGYATPQDLPFEAVKFASDDAPTPPASVAFQGPSFAEVAATDMFIL